MYLSKSGATSAALAMAALLGSAPARAEMSEAGKEAMVQAGRVLFDHRCHTCHSVDPNTPSYGPSLIGVIGRKAGSLEGFAYSDALKASGIVWTEEGLKAWVANNTSIMPGTRMRHVGITDSAEQDFLIAYIKSLKK